jgi:hypothetical protein
MPARTGASSTAVTLMSRDCVLLSLLPSLTLKVTVRFAVVGLSLVFVYLTERRTVW